MRVTFALSKWLAHFDVIKKSAAKAAWHKGPLMLVADDLIYPSQFHDYGNRHELVADFVNCGSLNRG
jgi:hypothetical protein